MSLDKNLYKNFIKNIYKTKKKENIYNVLWKTIQNQNKKYNKSIHEKIKIAIINTPCHGFGDIIFAQKLSSYLKEWYNCEIKIFTTHVQEHIKLGENPENIISPVKMLQKECRKFYNLKFSEDDVNQKYDLYLVAPLTVDDTPNKNHITKKFKFATNFNVFFFSEYNANIKYKYDFHTGIGRNKDGIFLTKNPPTSKIESLKNPYSVIYIASNDHIDNAKSCYLGFIELITTKYKKYKNLDVVVPEWIAKDVINNPKNLIKKIQHLFPNIVVKNKHNSIMILGDSLNNKKTFTIRNDILPVDNKKMFSVIKYSIKDILLTGDQSITDALSCCYKKNIFYQIAPWKISFSRQLAKELPNEFLKKKTTSCGTLKALKYNSDYNSFVKTWDFRKKSKNKLDSLILSIIYKKKYQIISDIIDIINKSRTLNSAKNRLDNLYV